MTIRDGKKMIGDFVIRAERDGDPYLIVHFSRIEDEYRGYDNGMDQADALLVIQQLVRAHEINPEALAEFLRVKETTI
jgi:hypothetical protein